jgi:hypothetical protein
MESSENMYFVYKFYTKPKIFLYPYWRPGTFSMLNSIIIDQHLNFTSPWYCHIVCVWLQTRFWLVNGFIDHFYTPLGTTSNYSATANLHNSQITISTAKPFPACCVFANRSLATASNNGDSWASRAQVLPSQRPVQNSTKLTLSLAYNISTRTT